MENIADLCRNVFIKGLFSDYKDLLILFFGCWVLIQNDTAADAIRNAFLDRDAVIV